MIAVEAVETPAGAADEARALARIDAGGGIWLGCDVSVPGLYRREAKAALDPLLSVYLDGRRLRIVPHGDSGRALAAALPPLAGFEAVQGRLEQDCAAEAGAPHPALTLLRELLAAFELRAPEFGFYGTLAFDYYRLAHADDVADGVPDDGRRRLVLMLPQRVLCAGDGGHRWLEFRFPGLAPQPGTQAGIEPVQLPRRGDDLPRGGHAAAVARGVERMRRGELCSLVLSQTFRRAAPQVDAAAAFERLRRDNPYPAMFFAQLGGGERVFGASPDVQVRADGQWVETAPVCGTIRRGADPVDDHEQAKALLGSEVDEASLALCADSDRNDKALVCVPGSVELLQRRRLHFFSTIVHTIDHTRGRRRSGVDGFDIVLAHATPATVTGMPKADARRAIAELEAGWRGWYAGAAVRFGSDGSCEALTMLRFARLADGCAEVRTGGSLLADSEPGREEAETQLKAESMFRVLAGQSPRPPLDDEPAPPPRRVRFVDTGDALAALAREALVQAGCRFDDAAALRVLGDAPLPRLREQALPADGPLLALNNAALRLLELDGARAEALALPQFGRGLACEALPGLLQPLGRFHAGVHATHSVGALQLPEGWTLLARGADGRVAAALHPARRIVALLFRPDALRSLQRRAGQRALLAALQWLHESAA
ncbi:MAG TPA: chorismate-binding protein [Rubrivivax sp.]|nr:chorismate-binding protein [Rubrivivax sp.]